MSGGLKRVDNKIFINTINFLFFKNKINLNKKINNKSNIIK